MTETLELIHHAAALVFLGAVIGCIVAIYRVSKTAKEAQADLATFKQEVETFKKTLPRTRRVPAQ